MKVMAIIQARIGSTRLPGKVMKKIKGKPLIELLLRRLSLAESLNSIIVAVSDKPENSPLIQHVLEMDYPVYIGDENDVLKRYFMAANTYQADIIVRITADCPLIDPALVDKVVNKFSAGTYDYVSNVDPRSYPKGLDVEVFSFEALQLAHDSATTPFDREHVTPFIREGLQFRRSGLCNDTNFSQSRWTVDEASDFIVIEKVFEHFHPNIYFTWKDVLELEEIKPQIFEPNLHLRSL